MGDKTGLTNTEARELCKPPDPETKVSFYSAMEMSFPQN
jgi:hypothetical protein